MQCEIAAVYMSGNLRHTKQLINELTVPTTGHQGKQDAAISIAVKRVTAKTSRLICDVCGQSAHYYDNGNEENPWMEANPMIELHHKTPWIETKDDHPDNLVTVHTECHPAYHQTENVVEHDDVTGDSSN